MGLFDKTATATAGQDPGDISTSGMGSLLPKLFQKAITEGTINPNNTSLQDFESFVVTNPDIVDPGIDVSGLRTTTDANILGNITDFPGIQYEAYNPSRLSDLMRLYSSGLPTTDTAQIPGAIDTLVDAGGGGGMDQVTGGLDTPTDGLTQSGTFGGQPTFTTTPGTTVDDITGDITNPDGSYGGNIVDEVALTGAAPSGITGDPIEVGIPDSESGFVDPLGTISGRPDVFDINVVGDPALNPGSTMVQGEDPYGTPEQKEGFLQNVLGRAGQTVNNALTELSKVPGAVIDFANQTVDIFGQKLNVGKTLLGAGINKLVGGPVSLVFDLLPSEDPADTLNRSIVDELKAEKNYGFNIQSGNLNQDPFGRNPVSGFGNYEQTLLDDAVSTSTTKMGLAKKEFAQDYFDKKAGKTAPQEDIGATDSLDQLQAAETKEQQEAFADIQNQIGQSLHGGDDPAPAPAPAAPTNVGNPFGYGGGGGRDSGGDGGGGGSPGSAGPGGSDEMGSF